MYKNNLLKLAERMNNFADSGPKPQPTQAAMGPAKPTLQEKAIRDLIVSKQEEAAARNTAQTKANSRFGRLKSWSSANKGKAGLIGAGLLAAGGAGTYALKKHKKEASYYETGKYLLEKDASLGQFTKYVSDKLKNGGDKWTMQGVKNLAGSTLRKGKHQINKGKAWIKEKSISALNNDKGEGAARFNSLVSGTRKAAPWVGGTAIGAGSVLGYNKLRNQDNQ